MAHISSRRSLTIVALAAIMLASSPATLGGIAAAQQVQVSIQFREALQPYGRWERHSRWGEVWIPRDRPRDWRPYTVGRWVYTEEWGWYWVEDREEADWGWAAFHYGRWVSDRELGWVWIAGEEWGPGFVQWRYGEEYAGWAPLPPDEVLVEYRDEPRFWAFVRVRDFTSPRISRVMISEREQTLVIRQTVVVNQTIVVRGQGGRIAVNPGIPPTYIAAAVGRPIRAYEVRPRVLAGTVRIQGAIEVRPGDVRRARPVEVRESRTAIPASDRRTPLQPLQAGEQGRLGDNPPKAALRAQQGQPKEQGQPKDQALPKDQQQPGVGGQPKDKDGRAVQEQKQEGKAKQREGKAVEERKQKDVDERVKEKQRARESEEVKDLRRGEKDKQQQGTEGRRKDVQKEQERPREGREVKEPQKEQPKERAGEKQKQQGIERPKEPQGRAVEKEKQPAATERRKEEPRVREKAEPKEQQRSQEPRGEQRPPAAGAGAPPREKQKEKEKEKEK